MISKTVYKRIEKAKNNKNSRFALTSGNYLLNYFPEELLELTWLKKLILDCCSLPELPSNIDIFTELTELSLSINNLKEIPNSIKNLQKLKILDLSNNKISVIPNIINELKLNILKIGCNPLKEFPDLKLDKLKSLSINEIGIDIDKEMGCLINLEYIDISSNKLEYIPQPVLNINSLKEIQAACNNICTSEIDFSKLNNLEILKLPHNSVPEIPKSLKNLTNLKELFIWNNNINEINIDVIMSCEKLNVLCLIQNPITKIPRELLEHKSLRKLDVDKNNIDEKSSEIVNDINSRK